MRGYGAPESNSAKNGGRQFASRSFSDTVSSESMDFYSTGTTERKKSIPRGQYDPRDFRRDPYVASEARRRSNEQKKREDVEDARQKAASRRRSVEHRRGFFLAVAILAVLIGFIAGLYKLVFVVRSVSVEGDSRYSAEEIIAASGIRQGVNLYSFRASTADASVTLGCPYIEKAEVKRTVPSTVVLSVTEDVPLYYTDIFGKTKILSDGLRVLETLEDGENPPDGLIKLKLPGIIYSVEGRLLRFAGEKDERGIRATLTAASESALAGRITVIDLRNPFDIKAQCDGKYLLLFGGSSEIGKKFKAAAKVLEDPMFASGNRARLELSDVTKTSVVFDNSIELD